MICRTGHPTGTDAGTASARAVRSPFRRRLIIMVKQPVGGRVKTRLARETGLCRALAFYRHSTAAVIARLSVDPRWQTTLAVSPDAARFAPLWPSRLARMAQGGGDLGRRMQSILARTPRGPAIIIGSDIPGITATHIAEAFRLLGAHRAVLGPTADGGYWLVGASRRPSLPKPFADVRWSSRHALADTQRNLSGLAVAHCAALQDVDDAADLARMRAICGRRVLPCGA